MAWFDRDGRRIGAVATPPDLFQNLSLSPDDSRAVLMHNSSDGAADVWTVDLARGLTSRLTADITFSEQPRWSPDGRSVVFAAITNGVRVLYRTPASGAGSPTIFLRGASGFTNPELWSPDGSTILYRELDPETGEDVWAVSATDSSRRVPVLHSRFHELDPALSPDGRWLAFRSDESGRAEIYVQSYPDPDTRFRVSSNGAGSQMRIAFGGPHWRRDGRELVFLSGDGVTVMTADVAPGPVLHVGTPRPLLRLPPGIGDLDPTSDHQRFLVLEDRADAEGECIHLLINWTAALPKR
jgi:Tol biopolymer transport system component